MAKVGRPETINTEIKDQLKQAFAIGASDEEACSYANIACSVLYAYQERHPEFLEEKNRLKQKPILKARQEVVKGLDNNPEFSLKFMERKKKDEFSIRTEHTGQDGEAIQVIINKNP